MGGSNEPPLDPDNVPSALAANKAVVLCWIFHLVGDVHQPLHVVSMFTPELPDGDRGGNLIFVRPRPDSPPMRLHAFWDNATGVTLWFTPLIRFPACGEPNALYQGCHPWVHLPRQFYCFRLRGRNGTGPF